MEKKSLWLGIDNGFNGAIVGLGEDKAILEVCFMPTYTVELKTRSKKTGKVRERRVLDEAAVIAIIKRLQTTYDIRDVAIEEAVAMPGQSSQSTATTFFGYGFLRGALLASGIPYRRVHPTAWTKYMFGSEKEEVKGGKERTVRVTAREWPNFDFTFGKKHAHDGVCDAALIALYGFMAE